MPSSSPDFWTLVLVLVVSAVSGVIGILNKIYQGRAYSIVWVASEFLAAILCGYLAYDTYPNIAQSLPSWVEMPMFVAACAHTGGRLLQFAGDALTAWGEIKSGGKND